MNIPQLQYFYEIGRCGNFTEAAKVLHVTQPSLSKAISALEEELGCRLFHRMKGGVVLTEPGKVLYEQTGLVLRELNKLENMAQAQSSVLIGIPPTIGHCFMPSIIRMTQAPGMPAINWKESGTAVLEQLLHKGQIDAALLPKSFVLEMDRLEYLDFAPVEEVLYVSQDHPLAKAERITREMVEEETFVLFSQDYNQNLPFDQLFDHAGFKPKRVTYTSQLSTALDIVEKNMAVTILIDEILKREAGKYAIQAIPLYPPYKLELIFGWEKGNPLRSLKAVIKAIKAGQI